MALVTVADMSDAQLETARTNYAEALGTWAAKGTVSTLTRYCAARFEAVTAEIARRAK